MNSSISRRCFVNKSMAVLATATAAATGLKLFAQKASVTGAQFRESGKTARIDAHLLRNGVSILIGSGGNILVLPGKDGKVIVDSGLATSESQITTALAALSSEPTRHLLNTHWHFDHTDGNEWMHRSGATIVAHENTRSRMNAHQEIPAFSIVLEPSPAAALPTVVFKESYELKLNGETIRMQRYTPAHTDSDVSVFFEHANVLHTGDTWFNGYYPFIDYDSGGSIDGLVMASAENLARANASTLVIPGHGGVGDRRDLIAFREMLLEVRGNVSDLKKKGHPVEAAIRANPTAKFDQKLAGGFVSADLFTRLIYRGV
jgi:glyoxylase-like metal-dependent hydrolase (beta-lactamase superfamily II)